MAKIPNAVEKLPKFNYNRMRRVHERYRQTTDRLTSDSI